MPILRPGCQADDGPAFVRLDDPSIRVVGTSESVLAMYPVRPTLQENGSWIAEYTGSESKIYDETSEQRERAFPHIELLWQDENGEDVPTSNLGVLILDDDAPEGFRVVAVGDAPWG